MIKGKGTEERPVVRLEKSTSALDSYKSSARKCETSAVTEKKAVVKKTAKRTKKTAEK